MATTLEQILSYLADSKEIPLLPTAATLPSTGWIVFYNPLTQQAEKISAAEFGGLGAWKWIENSWVEKDVGNSDNAVLEVNDIVYYKKIANAGDPLTLVGYTYTGGDKTVEGSYTQNQVITT